VAKPVDPVYPIDNENLCPLTPPNLSQRTPNKSAAAALAAKEIPRSMVLETGQTTVLSNSATLLTFHLTPCSLVASLSMLMRMLLVRLSASMELSLMSEFQEICEYPSFDNMRLMLIVSRDSGRSKGFGYVVFDSIDGAKAGLEAMQGKEVAGRPVHLDYAAGGRPALADLGPPTGFGGVENTPKTISPKGPVRETVVIHPPPTYNSQGTPGQPYSINGPALHPLFQV
jgi:RNA recognition motif-containing protein